MKGSRPFILILLAGLLIRLVFMLFLAEPYFGRENIHVDGDTYPFAWGFQNLLETGEYTVNPAKEYGYFGRMPGYPFFCGIFYLLAGRDWEAAFVLIAWAQVLLDLVSSWLVFLIAGKLSGRRPAALTAMALYAAYPFVIVWTPVVYSELLGVHLMLLVLYFFVYRERRAYLLLAGLSAGAGILVRPQLALLLPLMATVLAWQHRKGLRTMLVSLAKLSVLCLLVYGTWPARNLALHGKLIFTQDLRGFYNWDEDVLAFLQYIYSVQAGWEPQATGIIRNQEVAFPREAYRTPEDSLMLGRAVYLAKHCGSGFSHKKGYWGASFDEPNCNRQIAALFNRLRENQIRYNPLNFYVKVPLQNLKKALFKSSLTESGSKARRLASLLFYYRTVMIFAGLGWFASILRRRPANGDILLIPAYFLLLYLLLCAGTSLQTRNIEIRYFLPADVLLLIPAAMGLSAIRSGRRSG